MILRPDALGILARRYTDQPVVITLGTTIREVLAVAGRRPNHLLTLDSMGQAAAIGLGVALGVAGRDGRERVIVVEGDGSLLMGFSTLATIGELKPSNLVLVVFDNSVYLATGGQPTSGQHVDLVQVALGCGFAAARQVDGDVDAFSDALDWVDGQEGPVLLVVKVAQDSVPSDYFLEDPVLLGRTFADWLRGDIA